MHYYTKQKESYGVVATRRVSCGQKRAPGEGSEELVGGSSDMGSVPSEGDPVSVLDVRFVNTSLRLLVGIPAK